METWMQWLLLCWHLLLFHISLSHSLCHPHENFSLLQFKNSFTINTNVYHEHFYKCLDSYPKTTTWKNETDCCSWFGVTCHPIFGHVTGLDLTCSGLQGKIHPNSTLFNLYHLQSLNLAFNFFHQSQLSSHFGVFVSLTHLNLSGSDFEGEIPSQISHLSKLASLDLSFNDQLRWKEDTWKKLLKNATVLRELVLHRTDMSSVSIRTLNMSTSLVTLSLARTWLRGNLTNDILCLPNLQELHVTNFQGQLPKVSCRTTSLSYLDLSWSDFQGSIPLSFSNLTHLNSLDLSHNNLNGSIPSSLLTLPHLTFLNLGNNHLSGQIPNTFPESSRFEDLDLSYNSIEGELPSTLSNLQDLIFLFLSYNKFSGQIPDVFAELTKLNTLYLNGNKLGGQVPSSLFGLTQLTELDCSNNKLQGPLPHKITGFSNLTCLSFSGNLLNGTIPSWCLSLTSLEYLYLSENQFTGYISPISSYSLINLDLSNNNLEGNIPESIFSLVNLTNLTLSSNNLSGSIQFPLFSNLQNLEMLVLSKNNLSLNFQSNVSYSFSCLRDLDISSMGLTEFPKLPGKVPILEKLDLSNNKLVGRVPTWLFEPYLSQNLLTYSLNQFSTNLQLFHLDLSFNSLTGGISSSICNSSTIEILNLSHNKLTGFIPQCLANVSSLFALDLHMNNLYGTLPSTFSKDNLLNILDLSGNQLDGHLPESLSNCTLLEVLNLGNNQIEDTFSHWLQSLPNLKVLVLRANKLHGSIANLKTKHGFPNLVIFDISSNNFSWPIPIAYIKKFEAMKNVVLDEEDSNSQYIISSYTMQYWDSVSITTKSINMNMERIRKDFVCLDLSRNRFEGKISNVIGELHALKGLNLSHNKLSGHIPKSMGNLTKLESLDLSSNMLTDIIPTELINLNFLEVLNLSNNHLVGEIPQGKQFNTFSNDSYEENSGLCGLPLTTKCNKDPEQHSPPSLTFMREQGFGISWKPVAIGYGCGLIFGVGMGCCVLLIGKPQWLVRMVNRKTGMHGNN